MTSTEDRCDITELLVAHCGCRKHRGKPKIDFEVENLGLGPWFMAKYPGKCAGCETEFAPGNIIRADGEGGYLCVDCGASAKMVWKAVREGST